jgi:hypothetical protein
MNGTSGIDDGRVVRKGFQLVFEDVDFDVGVPLCARSGLDC